MFLRLDWTSDGFLGDDIHVLATTGPYSTEPLAVTSDRSRVNHTRSVLGYGSPIENLSGSRSRGSADMNHAVPVVPQSEWSVNTDLYCGASPRSKWSWKCPSREQLSVSRAMATTTNSGNRTGGGDAVLSPIAFHMAANSSLSLAILGFGVGGRPRTRPRLEKNLRKPLGWAGGKTQAFTDSTGPQGRTPGDTLALRQQTRRGTVAMVAGSTGARTGAQAA
jgi:hypothetical protein